jgi:phospholipid/cholesterol/gamma-HCH transport system substrate-binding protein
MTRSFRTRILFGTLFFLGIVVLLILTTQSKDFSSLRDWALGRQTTLVVYFPEIGMLREGDSVRIAGIEIGKVHKLNLSQEGFVEIHEHLINDAGVVEDKLYRTFPPSSREDNIWPPKKEINSEGRLVEVRHVRKAYKVRAELSVSWAAEEKQGWLDHEYVIFAKQATFIGGMYVSIDPADARVEPWARKIQEGPNALNFARLEIASLEKVGDWFKESGDKIRTAIDRINKGEGTLGMLIKNPILHNKAEEVLDKIKQAADRFAPEETSTVTKLMKDEGKLFDKLEKAIDNISQAAERMKPSETSSVAKIMNDEAKLYDDVAKVAEDAAAISLKIRSGDGLIGRVIYNEELANDVSRLARNARELAEKINKGGGVAGKLVNDEDMANDLKQGIKEMKEMAESIKNTFKRIERGEGTIGRLVTDDTLIKKAESTVDSLEQFLGASTKIRTFLGFEIKSFGESGYSLSKAYARIAPREGKFFQAGVAMFNLDHEGPLDFKDKLEKGEDDIIIKPDVQLGYGFYDNRLTARIGFIEGKIGGGLDYLLYVPPLNHDFKLTLEMREAYSDVDDEGLNERVDPPLVRAQVSTELWNNLRLYAGANRLTDDPEFFGGVGFEYEDEDLRYLVSLMGASR